MAYASWSVVFGEQPSAAKWNILGTNDASFNDGTGIGSDVITDAKLIYGKLRSRQGGSATNWSTTGTNTYDYSGTNVFMQCGSFAYPGVGASTVTFPTAYNQIPLVMGTVITAGAKNSFFRVSAIGTTNFTFQALGHDDSLNAVSVAWIAIGE